MWTKLKGMWGWIVGMLVALLGLGVWRAQQRQKKAVKRVDKQRVVLEHAVLQAARRNKERNAALDKKVKDARSTGSLADRFNE